MAITKIHAIKATVHKAVNYICNPQKTEEGILISSFGCSPETASFDFKFALSKTSQSDPNLAFHLIQAFIPNEVSYQEAHRIGVELADKLLEGKYSYVVSTHIDKGHIHNHIIFCAADNVNHKKYHDCKQTYHGIRRLNDALCREHGLSVIIPEGTRGKTYKEWQSGKSDSAWKEQLKSDIDEAIKIAATYEDCIGLIRAKGYEVKGDAIGENSLKYISFRPLDRAHFVRGSAKSLGKKYTKERIMERIEEKALAAASYSQAGSVSELEKQIAAKSTLTKTARESLVETEHQLKDLGQILKYAEQYKANHIYHVRYQKSKNKEAYLHLHEMELILHDGAENMLKRFGIDTKTLNVEKLRSNYNALYSKKQALQKSYQSAEKETADLNRQLNILHQYLNHNPKQPIVDKKPDKSTHSF